MTPLKITVGGQSVITRQPERGTLQLTVKAEGSYQETVSKQVTEISNELSQLFKELSPKMETGEATADAPVTAFSSTFLRTWSHTHMNSSQRFSTAMVYHANVSLTAIFRDFTKLSEVVGKLVSYSNVEINSVDWCLTDATKKALGSDSRKEAVFDAVQKANDYAEAVGQKVVAVEITDEGQSSSGMMPQGRSSLFGGSNTGGGGLFGSSNANMNNNPPPPSILDLTPQQIQYTSSVHVYFEAVSDS